MFESDRFGCLFGVSMFLNLNVDMEMIDLNLSIKFFGVFYFVVNFFDIRLVKEMFKLLFEFLIKFFLLVVYIYFLLF